VRRDNLEVALSVRVNGSRNGTIGIDQVDLGSRHNCAGESATTHAMPGSGRSGEVDWRRTLSRKAADKSRANERMSESQCEAKVSHAEQARKVVLQTNE